MPVTSSKYSLDSKFEAKPFQMEAVTAVKDLEYCAIFHEQGLGKTKIAIDLLLYWLSEDKVDCAVVITKKGLVENWKKEIFRHTHIVPVVLTEGNYRNYKAIRSNSVLNLAHYELLKTDTELFTLLAREKKAGIVLDESQKIKTPSSALSEATLSISSIFTKRAILTGTPVANRPYDIWAQIFFLDEGASLGRDYKRFKAQFDLPVVKDPENLSLNETQKIDEFEKNLESLFGKIDKFSVRETKLSSGIKLPNKEYSIVLAEWEKNQRSMYEKIRSETRLQIEKEGKIIDDVSENLLKKLLRLVQITSNPMIIDDKYNSTPGKAVVLDSLVENIIEKNEKLIIWSTFTANVDWLRLRYKNFGAVKVHGKLNHYDRNRAISSFIEEKESKIFIATPGAAKEGLTLTVANHVIFFDRSFSLDDYLQSQDRIHRISQERTCYIYKLVLPNSIDEWIDSLISMKSAAAQFAQRDIGLNEYQSLVKYDAQELLHHILDSESEE
ncbi:MAG: ATP-dependent helicase [Pseudomonadales bacterium]|nr:ATP-dependent helicase [Pseudomonadales bacterium]